MLPQDEVLALVCDRASGFEELGMSVPLAPLYEGLV